MKKFALGIAIAMVVAASPANAATLLFSFADAGSPSFQLDSNPVPVSAGLFSFTTLTSNGTLNGAPFDFGTTRFFSSLGGGGVFSEFGSSGGFGQQLFSGTTAAPVFSPGTFSLVDFRNDPTTTLTISTVGDAGAVPEPTTWAMMLFGFCGIGLAMRRRSKVRTTVSYA